MRPPHATIWRTLLTCALTAQVVCAAPRGPAAAIPRRIVNLHAFARLYGVVRWFHPSDAAAATDWDRFAIEGTRRVANAPDADGLRRALTELFAPVAPTMQLAGPRDGFPAVPTLVLAGDHELVAWQHLGYGDSVIATGYASKRLHRDAVVATEGDDAAALFQAIDATPYRGSRIRLRGKLRTANHAQGQLWLRVERGETTVFRDTMANRPVTSSRWTDAEIVGPVDREATRIVLGELAVRTGTAWYDDLELAVEGEDGRWRPIALRDGDCEAAEPLRDWHPGVARGELGRALDGWEVARDPRDPAQGQASLRIQHTTRVIREELFTPAVAPGDTVTVELGDGLRARVPLALWSVGHQTLGDDPEVIHRIQAAPQVSSSGFDPLAGVADVIVLWNVLQHFWPYWDDVPARWLDRLDAALRDSLADRTVDDHVATLERLSEGAPDGHASTSCPGERELADLPFLLERVAHDVVVTVSEDPALERGDLVLSLDGEPIDRRLEAEMARVSGSLQWRTAAAVQRLTRAPVGSVVRVGLRRGPTQRTVTVSPIAHRPNDPPRHASIQRLEDGVYYVDLSRASTAELDAELGALAAAPGLVFDVRSRPQSNHEILSHLMVRPPDSSPWGAIAELTRPDHGAHPAAWRQGPADTMPSLSPRAPQLHGRVAFLTGPLAISYAESVMALISHYHLGAIVGSATAGTNGDIAEIGEPTGCSTVFTGRRVTRIDGGRFNLLGVQPTIPAARTLAGIAAGRDEVLERALAYVRSGH